MIDASRQYAIATASVHRAEAAQLRRALLSWLLADGLSRVLLVVLGLILADLAIDWYFRMDLVQRRWMLVLLGGAISWFVYRRLVRPLLVSLDDDELCLRVEARHRELAQSLISAVQLSRGRDPLELGLSPVMVQATIDQGARRSESVDFRSALDDFEFRRNLLLAVIGALAIAAIVIGVITARPSGALWIWFDRNVLLGDSAWPQDTYLEIRGLAEDGTLSLPRGDDWTQVIEAKNVVPSLVYLDYQPLKGRRSTDQMKLVGTNTFQTTFKNMLEEFQFRARGGDAYTPWIPVRLVDRPAVQELSLKLMPPDYTGLKPELLPPGRGPYSAFKGSRIELSGRANKPLTTATLSSSSGSQKLAITGGTGFQAIISADALAADTYSVELTDTVELASKRPAKFTVRIQPDREPAVKGRLDGISGMIVPGAVVPVDTNIQDDFAVTAARLVYQWRSEGSQEGGSSGDLRFTAAEGQFGQPKVEHLYPFDTAPLGLEIGATLGFHLEADDNDNVSGGPAGKTGKSDNFLLRVVSEEELRADLLRREKERRLEVERLLKDQEELMTDSRAILATVQDVTPLPDDQRSALVRVQKRQYLAAERATVIARQLSQLMAEVENNRLEEQGGPIQRRLDEQIVSPLAALGKESIPAAARFLDQARRVANDAEARDQQLFDAVRQQEQVAQSLREILKHMAKSEGYQEAVNLLYAILKSQGDVNQATLKEAQTRIRNIFSDGTDSAAPPPQPQQP